MKPLHNIMTRTLLTLILATAYSTAIHAQTFALKNNLLYDATLTPNLGAEVKLSKHSTIQAFYGLNPWERSDRKSLRHWSIMPEYRYWTKKAFRGTFFGLHGVGGEYNVGGIKLPFGLFKPLRDNQYEGSFVGGGLTLGHAWPLSRHFALEAAVGVGYIHTKYKQYENIECGDLLADDTYDYIGPTKLALNVVWLLGVKREKPIFIQPVMPTTAAVAQVEYKPQWQLPFYTPAIEDPKIRDINGQAFLDFPVNKTVIYPDYRGNRSELNKVIETIDVVRNDSNTRIRHISIHGYASPEGSYQNNTRLAEGRAAAFKEYIRQLIQLPDDIFSVQSTPEDWDGLRRRVSEGEYQLGHPDEILDIIDDENILDHDVRDQRIKARYPADYRLLLSMVYPALRHSDYVVSYYVRPFTAQEAARIIGEKPQQLSLNEMFMAAQTYEQGSYDYNEVFQTAVRMFPDDATANLNAAIIALGKGDVEAATRYLAKAGDSPEASNARGVLSARQGDRTAAEAHFRQAVAGGCTAAQHNLDELGKMR